MLEIVALVNRLLPGLLQHSRPSVACVCTTRAKYLVFDGDPSRPACIVEFGDEERLTRTDHILSTLRSKMPPGGVADSLCCTSLPDGTFVHIQEGLPGVPWFRLSDSLATPAAWEELLSRSVVVMGHLHAATRVVPAWTGTIEMGAELGRQEALCRRNGTPLDNEVRQRIGEWQDQLAATGPVQAWWQHGDFSLNNLLVSRKSVAVIDFDEFGLTLMPLHDAFGLALSLTLSQDGRCPLSRVHCLDVCTRGSLTAAALPPTHLPGLLMHHLLWRINQCYGVERRTRLRNILLGWVGELGAAPETFFAART
ncbi:MAG: phosphotransferase [Acidobacteriota bacterium]